MEHCAPKHHHSQLLRYLLFICDGHGPRAVIHSTMNTTNYEIKGARAMPSALLSPQTTIAGNRRPRPVP